LSRGARTFACTEYHVLTTASGWGVIRAASCAAALGPFTRGGSPAKVYRAAGLGVLPGEVGDAAGGWEAFERGVSTVMVVGVQPGVKGGAPFGF